MSDAKVLLQWGGDRETGPQFRLIMIQSIIFVLERKTLDALGKDTWINVPADDAVFQNEAIRELGREIRSGNLGSTKTKEEKQMSEAWRTFKEGDILRLVKPISETEKYLMEQEDCVYEFFHFSSKTHRYAVCEQWLHGSQYGGYMLRTEALERAEGIRLCPVCGIPVEITGKTKDGRLIGSCQHNFTLEQWED